MPWSKVAILGMVIPPLIGILIMGIYPYYWVDFPILYYMEIMGVYPHWHIWNPDFFGAWIPILWNKTWLSPNPKKTFKNNSHSPPKKQQKQLNQFKKQKQQHRSSKFLGYIHVEGLLFGFIDLNYHFPDWTLTVKPWFKDFNILYNNSGEMLTVHCTVEYEVTTVVTTKPTKCSRSW